MFGSLKVRYLGDPILRQKAKPVKFVGPVERMLINVLFETMKAQKGIGLAAVQVGVGEQIFVVDTGRDAFAVINPKIIAGQGVDISQEGCLSIPNVHVDVKRYKSVDVEFTDEENKQVRAKLSGLAAKVFQHEYDHLQGKLIIDYLSASEQKKIMLYIKDGVFIPPEKKSAKSGDNQI